MGFSRRARERLMATLPLSRIAELLDPYYPQVPAEIVSGVSVYLDLLLKWNARMNLTSIRTPELMVTRHFGESLFVARHLPLEAKTLLDVGSGAGFPGLPVQLARPDLRVTLAESQNKKGAFLREAVRVLRLRSVVWGGRVEAMPPEWRFDVVALRAVDDPVSALVVGRKRLAPGGFLATLTTEAIAVGESIPMPGSDRSYLHIF